MSALRRAVRLLVPRDWRDSVDRDLAEEIATARRAGLRTELWAAWQILRVAARLRFGDSSVTRAASGRRFPARGLGRDVQFAFRMIRREPWPAAAIVFTLALGIGAATAAYAVFNHVVFRPIPGIAGEADLFTVYFQPADDRRTFGAAPRTSLEVLRQAAGVDGLASAYTTEMPVVPRPDADPDHSSVELVTDQYLGLLGIRARAGRVFTDDEITRGLDVALISERMWMREFDGSPAAIGQQVRVNRHPFTIVGVVDRYQGWGTVRVEQVDLWLPMTAEPRLGRSDTTYFSLIGKVRPGATQPAVQEQLTAAFRDAGPAGLVMTYPGARTDWNRTLPAFVPMVYPGLFANGQEATRGRILDVYPFAMGATGLLLLLACANTANLLLARTVQRERELAVRSALGAGRWRLARGLLVEAGVLVVASLVAGLATAKLLTGLVRGTQPFAAAPELGDVGIDWRVVAFSAAVAGATVVLFGFVPALAAARVEFRQALRQTGRVTHSSRRLRAILVCVQLALSLTLIAGAGVLGRSLHNLRSVDLGMKPDGVVSFSLNGRRLGLTNDQQNEIVSETLRRLRSTPGVEAAAYASPQAFWRDGWFPARVRPASAEAPDIVVETGIVSGEFFSVLGIPQPAGRTFAESEFLRPPGKSGGVGVINLALARRLFGAESAVGRLLDVGDARPEGEWRFRRQLTIVGVVGDTRSGRRFRDDERAALYEPSSSRLTTGTIYVRSTRSAAAMISEARQVVRQIEPNLPIISPGTLRDEVERLIPEERMLAYLISVVAVFATLLGMAGIYAVVAYMVNERTREFGIRIALGAPASAVARNVLRGVGVLSLVGVAAGLALFAIASRMLATRVYGLSPLDPYTLAAATMLLLATAVGASWLPARRATRVDPTVALRAD